MPQYQPQARARDRGVFLHVTSTPGVPPATSFASNVHVPQTVIGEVDMPHPATIRPQVDEYSPAVANYVGLVPEGDLLAILAQQAERLRQLVGSLTDEQALVHHAPYTWSIKQVVGHMTDCERVFGYRAM